MDNDRKSEIYNDLKAEMNIPNSVKEIKSGAFEGRTSLTTINIPNSVEEIGDDAFSGCTNLTTINIPDSVEVIGYGAFQGCTNLTTINIPDSVEEIGDDAFSGCTSLTTINIPNSVKEIKWGAFKGCTNLTTINIPDSVEKIGYEAFKGCTSLTTINIPNSVEKIGACAFKGCTSLTTINIPNSVEKIGACAFEGCKSLKTINIPDSVKEIGWYAFEGCTSLTTINIPDSVEEIGEKAFVGCTSLSLILVNEGVCENSGGFIAIGIENIKDTKAYYSPRIIERLLKKSKSEKVKKVSSVLEKGIICYENHDYNNAFVLLNSAIKYATSEQLKVVGEYLGQLYFSGQYNGTTVINRNFAKAIEFFKIAANNGNAKTAMFLGDIYRVGLGVEQNESTSLAWYILSSDYGNPRAQYIVAMALYKADKYEKAFSIFEKASEQGYTKANCMLGKMYYEGKGVGCDYTKAAGYLKSTANLCDAQGKYYLALLYHDGRGIEQSYENAISMYKKSAEEGYVRSAFNLGMMYYSGSEINKNLLEAEKWLKMVVETDCEERIVSAYTLAMIYKSEEMYADNISKVAPLLEISAKAKCKDSAYLLGMMYYEAKGVKQDCTKAAKWLETCDIIDNNTAYILGMIYYNGDSVNNTQPDYKKALKWLEIVASGDGTIEYIIGKIYYLGGNGINKDFSQGIKWLEKACTCKDTNILADSQYLIGEMYYYGDDNVPIDCKKAIEMFTLSADNNNKNAILKLAQIYHYGNGKKVNKDLEKALHYYKMVDDQNTDKKQFMAYCYFYGMFFDEQKELAFKLLSEIKESEFDNSSLKIISECYCYGFGTEVNMVKSARYQLKYIAKEKVVNDDTKKVLSMCANELKNSKEDECQLLLGDCYYYLVDSDKQLVVPLVNIAIAFHERASKMPKTVSKKVFKWYSTLAEMGNLVAMNNLGVCYDTGTGVTSNKEKAFYWFEKAAQGGNRVAQRSVGICYRYGDGCEKSLFKAFAWLRSSAKKGYEPAYKSLFFLGEEAEKTDINLAFLSYDEASKYGYEPAYEKLYELGIKVENSDADMSLKCIKFAESYGYEPAKLKLLENRINDLALSFDEVAKRGWDELYELYCHKENEIKEIVEHDKSGKLTHYYKLIKLDKMLNKENQNRHKRMNFNEKEGYTFDRNFKPTELLGITEKGSEAYNFAYELEKFGRVENSILAYWHAAKLGDRNARAVVVNMGTQNTLYFLQKGTIN